MSNLYFITLPTCDKRTGSFSFRVRGAQAVAMSNSGAQIIRCGNADRSGTLSDETTPKATAYLGHGSRFLRFARCRWPRFSLVVQAKVDDRDIAKFITVLILSVLGRRVALACGSCDDGVHAAGILPERGLTSLEQKKNIFGIVNPRENMRMSNPSLSKTGHYEHACDQAIAMCNGNLRSTIKALIMANEYLEAELEELHTAIAAGCAPARAPHAGSNAA